MKNVFGLFNSCYTILALIFKTKDDLSFETLESQISSMILSSIVLGFLEVKSSSDLITCRIFYIKSSQI